jgi:hypothetical protein
MLSVSPSSHSSSPRCFAKNLEGSASGQRSALEKDICKCASKINTEDSAREGRQCSAIHKCVASADMALCNCWPSCHEDMWKATLSSTIPYAMMDQRIFSSNQKGITDLTAAGVPSPSPFCTSMNHNVFLFLGHPRMAPAWSNDVSAKAQADGVQYHDGHVYADWQWDDEHA